MIKIGTQDIATIPGVMKVTLGNRAVWCNPELVPSGYRRLTGIVFDGEVFYATTIILEGSDTLKLSFEVSKACNVIGCYTSDAAQNNYSLYVGDTSSSKYMRYNGGTYSGYVKADAAYSVVISPTGTFGLENDDTWEEKTFTSSTNMLIGSTSLTATSAKLTGVMYGNIEVVGKGLFIPVERVSDGEIGYYEAYSGAFLTNQGSGVPLALGYA